MANAEEKVIQLGEKLCSIFQQYFGSGENPFQNVVQNPGRVVDLLLSYDSELKATDSGLLSFLEKMDIPPTYSDEMKQVYDYLCKNQESVAQLFAILNKIRKLAKRSK